MAKIDIKITKDEINDYFDIDFDSEGDINTIAGFETALQMSFFCERRADESEVAPPQLRRGWWGNLFSRFENFEIGSKIWLLYQSRNDQDTQNSAEDFATDGYQWLVTDKYADRVDVSTTRDLNDIGINIKVFKNGDLVNSSSFKLWQDTVPFSI